MTRLEKECARLRHLLLETEEQVRRLRVRAGLESPYPSEVHGDWAQTEELESPVPSPALEHDCVEVSAYHYTLKLPAFAKDLQLLADALNESLSGFVQPSLLFHTDLDTSPPVSLLEVHLQDLETLASLPTYRYARLATLSSLYLRRQTDEARDLLHEECRRLELHEGRPFPWFWYYRPCTSCRYVLPILGAPRGYAQCSQCHGEGRVLDLSMIPPWDLDP